MLEVFIRGNDVVEVLVFYDGYNCNFCGDVNNCVDYVLRIFFIWVSEIEWIIFDICNGEIGIGGSVICEISWLGCYGFGEVVVDMVMCDLVFFFC